MKGRQIDGFEKINRPCHSLADFAHAGCANGSPGTSQNQEQLQGSSPIGTFARIYQPVFFVGMPSLAVPVTVARVTSLSFPSLRKVGDLYSKRLDSPSGRC